MGLATSIFFHSSVIISRRVLILGIDYIMQSTMSSVKVSSGNQIKSWGFECFDPDIMTSYELKYEKLSVDVHHLIYTVFVMSSYVYVVNRLTVRENICSLMSIMNIRLL